MQRLSRIQLHERKRNYRFALTPFADAMFQLLIFFMLSSSMAPYSMLTLQTAPGVTDGAAAPADEGVADQPPGPALAAEVVLWTVEQGRVSAGGQNFDFSELDALAEALGAGGVRVDVVLVVRSSARVQDVTTVLARLRLANVGSVQISAGAL